LDGSSIESLFKKNKPQLTYLFLYTALAFHGIACCTVYPGLVPGQALYQHINGHLQHHRSVALQNLKCGRRVTNIIPTDISFK